MTGYINKWRRSSLFSGRRVSIAGNRNVLVGLVMTSSKTEELHCIQLHIPEVDLRIRSSVRLAEKYDKLSSTADIRNSYLVARIDVKETRIKFREFET